MSIVFASKLDFERAVMEVLKEHLHLTVDVRKVSDGDYYNPGYNTKVAVKLGSEYHGDIAEASDQA